MDLPLRPLWGAFGRTGTVPWYEYINAGLRRGVPEEVMSEREVWVMEVKSPRWFAWKSYDFEPDAKRAMEKMLRTYPHWVMRVARYIPAHAPKKAKARKS